MFELQFDVTNGDRATSFRQADGDFVQAGAKNFSRDDRLGVEPAGVLKTHPLFERTRFAAISGVCEVGPVNARKCGVAFIYGDDGCGTGVGIQNIKADDGDEWLGGEVELPSLRCLRFQRKADDAGVEDGLDASEKF